MNLGLGSELGVGISQSNTNVYYVPIEKKTMLDIQNHYLYGDSYISRANMIRSDLAFGSGFYLEFAEKSQVLPTDSYDYTHSIKNLLETARKHRDMFGFVGFVQRNESAREEVERQKEAKENGHERTAGEVAERHIEHCESIIYEKIKGMNTKKRPRSGSSNTDGGGGEDDDDPDSDVKASKKRSRAKIESVNNGTKLFASDARLVIEKGIKKTKSMREKSKKEEKRRQSIQEMLISIENIEIITPEEGQFYLEIDNLMHKRRIVWAPAWRQPFSQSRMSRTAAGYLTSVDYDPNVTVFVWRIPSDTGNVRSDFLELMRLHEMVLEAEDNAMDADYQMSHPVPFVHHTRGANRTDIDDLPEEDVYGFDLISKNGAFSKDTMTPTDMQTYRRDMRSSILMEEQVSKFNEDALIGRMGKISDGDVRRSKVVGAYGRAAPSLRSNVLERTGIMELPGGLQLGGQVKSDTVIDLGKLRAVYDLRISVAMGVPLTYLQGQKISSQSFNEGSASGSSSNSTMSSIMRTTIATDREEMSRFFDEMYDTLFHEVDNEALESQLSEALSAKSEIDKVQAAYEDLMKKRYDIITDVPKMANQVDSLFSEAARICSIENELRRIASLKYRLRLKFVKAPFVEANEIDKMYSLGAISHAEMVNLMRVNNGLEKADEKTIDDIRTENIEMIKQRAEAEHVNNVENTKSSKPAKKSESK